jgi:outer membrane protein assembly factor BamB
MKLRIAVWVLAGLSTAAPALAGDWYQWRGPEQDGVSREKNLPEKWSPDGDNVIWKAGVGGMSSPIVMNGCVYAFTRVGEVPAGDGATASLDPGPKTQEALTCVDAKTGKILWQHAENMYVSDDPFHRLGWSNVVGDPKTGRVYGLGAQNELVCCDGKTGDVIWKHQMMEEYGMITTFGGRTPSPAIDEDQLLITGVSFGWGNNFLSQHRIYAFDKNTGALNWTTGSGGIPVDAPYGTPVVGVVNGERIVVFNGGDGGFHAFQVRTGKKLWSYKPCKRGMNCSPILSGNFVYCTWDLDNFSTTKLGGVACLDATEIKDGAPKVVWREDGIEAGFPSSVLVDDVLYVPTDSAVINAFDTKTGKLLWHKGYGTIGKASLVYGDGKLYFPEANGRVWILKLNGKEKPTVLSHEDIEEKMGREYTIFGSFAISNGQLFLQTATSLFCIGPKDPKVESDPIPEAPKEEPAAADAVPAILQVRPADVVTKPGGKTKFSVLAFDAKGKALGEPSGVTWAVGQLTVPPPPPRPTALMRPGALSVAGATPPPAPVAPASAPATQPAVAAAPTQVGNLKGEVDAAGNFTAAAGPIQGGAVIATVGKLTGEGRARVFPPLPWKIDFDAAPVAKPPLTWIGAGMKFAVREMDAPPGTKPLADASAKNHVLVKLTDIPLFARARTYFGAEDMHDYTLQADVMVKEIVYDDNGTKVHKLPDVGIINSRYILELKGSRQTVGIHSWPAALPRTETEPGLATHVAAPFEFKADTWYHEKLMVSQEKDKAVMKGKVWKSGEPEPEAWTVQLEDSTPNRNGSPGFWGFSNDLEIYYDNVVVSENKQ